MSSLTKFSPKDPAETILVSFDFSNLMKDTSEKLIAAVWNASVVTGIDPTPHAILTGIPFLQSTSSVGYLTGGVAGVTYLVTVIGTTNKGQTLKISASIIVKVQV